MLTDHVAVQERDRYALVQELVAHAPCQCRLSGAGQTGEKYDQAGPGRFPGDSTDFHHRSTACIRRYYGRAFGRAESWRYRSDHAHDAAAGGRELVHLSSGCKRCPVQLSIELEQG